MLNDKNIHKKLSLKIFQNIFNLKSFFFNFFFYGQALVFQIYHKHLLIHAYYCINKTFSAYYQNY